jgi:hypothetical protein
MDKMLCRPRLEFHNLDKTPSNPSWNLLWLTIAGLDRTVETPTDGSFVSREHYQNPAHAAKKNAYLSH